MNATDEEKKLGNSLDERRQALSDKTKFKYDEKRRVYVSLENEKVCFDEDGEQIIAPKSDDTFSDVRKQVLINRYGYTKAMQMLQAEKDKGGK